MPFEPVHTRDVGPKWRPALDLTAGARSVSRISSWQQGLHRLEDLAVQGIRRDVRSYSAVSAKAGWALGTRLLEALVYGLLRVDAIACSVAITSCARAAQWRRAVGAVGLSARGAARPDTAVYNAAMSGCGSTRRWRHALALLEAAKIVTGYNAITCNTAISACEKAGQPQASMLLLAEARRTRLADVITYNAAMSACEGCSLWQTALVIFDGLGEDAVEPDVISFNTTISSCGLAKEWERALSLIQHTHTRVNAVTYGAAVNACEKATEWALSVNLLILVQRDQVKVDLLTCGAAISACAERGLWTRAGGLLREITAHGLEADLIACNAALSALSTQWRRAGAMFGQLSRPNLVTFNACFSACEAAQWRHVLELLREMALERLRGDFVTFSSAEHLEHARYEAEKYREKEVMLGWDPSDFEKLTEAIEKLQPYDDLWELVYRFTSEEKKWMRGPLFSLEPEAVDTLANGLVKRANKLQGLFESISLPIPAGVAKKIKKDLDAFKQHLPLIHALCNPGLRPRHWDEISEVVGFSMERDSAFTLSRVVDMDVGTHLNALQEISDSASREYGLEKTLESINEQWQPVNFELKAWKDTETYIVASTTVDEMQSLMDDHIIKVQTMKGSPYAKAFMEKIQTLEHWLLQTQEIMDIWQKVQGVWLYLEPIFSSEDIVKQMPTEASIFKQVDMDWRATMAAALEAGKAMEATKAEGLLELLQKCNANLETVQKGLNDYLEMKRLAFPRFFFLSNDNLLEILSETKDPTRVNPHMKKAFEGIQSLEFQPDQRITAMISSEKEVVSVVNPVDPHAARGNVELWLVEVEAAMLETIRHVCLASEKDYLERKFTDWLKQWPGQAVIAIFCLFWTRDVETGLRNNDGVTQVAEKLRSTLTEIIDLVRNDIPPLTRCTLEALIVIFVHNKDTVEELGGLGIKAADDFDWLVQLRYYVEDNPEKPHQTDLFVRITNSFLGYAYEYLGNSSRLIVTPLTDRCYRTCCGALHLLYGAAPEGPAGTGKTETVKDLAKALARFCVVFNCSDELDYLAMAKFFKGLAASGGWACFDEFNRIDAEVLSVIAQQILCIQNAIKEKRTHFEFEGTELPIIWTCNCFITMNPGYAGRAELPDNLKALFRTVAMMVPDYAMIAEIKLYSYGYEDSRSLAQKIVTTYKLCSEQLSSQKHYDYGMRAVFAVLVQAGRLKRNHPNQKESILMLQSVNDVNLAKFLDFDVPLYNGITRDLFPGVELPKPDYSMMVNKLTENLDVTYCQAHPYFIDKIIQFYECHLVRHSVMLVGMPFSGKTTALNTLQKSLSDLAQDGSMHPGCIVHQARLNPKSIPARDLYGCFEEVSREWVDGIVAVLFREFARNQTEERKWLVFDGPVDAVWIENMNTVMDENKKLCLNSGEIIAMSANMRTIIEPMDVEVASPATISRNGMVFFEPHLMGYQHLIAKTLKGGLPQEMDETERAAVTGMIEFLVPPLVSYVSRQCKTVSPAQEQNLVQSFLLLLTTKLQSGYKDPNMNREAADPKALVAMVDCYAIWCAIWGIGAACETGSRPMFGQFLRKLLTGQDGRDGLDRLIAELIDTLGRLRDLDGDGYISVEDMCAVNEKTASLHSEHFTQKNANAIRLQPNLPDRGSVFDYVVDLKVPGWTTWMETVESQNIANGAQVQNIIVQTVDNVRYLHVLEHCIQHRIKLLFCGPTGTGKTVYMQQALMGMPKETHMSIQIGFSAQTKCSQTQDLIDAKLERRRKGVYGPPMGRMCVVMVDDLNMPVKEKYGAMPPIEILRQSMDSTAYGPTGGWFDRKDPTHPFRSIIDVVYFAAMGPPGGGRNFITPRVLSHMYLVGFPLLDDDNMMQIFNTILEWKFRTDNYPADVAGLSRKIVQATLEIYKNTSDQLRPTPMKVHYTFNLRDFSKVICGVLLLKKNECEGTERHVRLWVHEILRVFGDRLIDDNDREWMLLQLREQTKKNFQVSFDDIMAHLDANKDGKVNTLDEVRTLFFGDMLSPSAVPSRPYTERGSQAIVAVGKNYSKHIAEMAKIGSAKDEKIAASAPSTPVLFLKPTTSYLPMGAGPILLPNAIGPIHHEVELGVVIGQRCKRVPEEKAMDVVVGYCIALDLTARDLQTAAKDKGLPWSVPKGYDHFTPVGQFIDKTAIPDPHNLELFCEVNGVQRQRGSTGEMIFKLPKLIAHISSIFTLEPGDLILTGTPEGVGPIEAGDKVRAGITGLVESEIHFDVAMDSE
ncbi:unnamed protein product [Effrenium voratum]|nr:unnamed protein product [Effrenium voratum]